MDAKEIIAKLDLVPHPTENGYFSRHLLYDSELKNCDIVQFLYEKSDYAPWHKMIGSDIIWIHQKGGTMKVWIVKDKFEEKELAENGVLVIPKDSWFTAQSMDDFALFSVVVTPGFSIENCRFLKENEYRETVEHYIPPGKREEAVTYF